MGRSLSGNYTNSDANDILLKLFLEIITSIIFVYCLHFSLTTFTRSLSAGFFDEAILEVKLMRMQSTTHVVFLQDLMWQFDFIFSPITSSD
jgi:hypothetical protein